MAANQKHPYRKLTLLEDAAFELRPSPGQGWGAFATKPIKKGDRVLDEKAWFFIYKDSSMSEHDDIKRAIQALERDRKEQILAIGEELVGNANLNNMWTTTEVMRLNSFPAGKSLYTGEYVGKGLYPLASRLNHSCRPNCSVPHHVHDRPLGIIATRDIAVDEELTFKYMGHLECLTKANRHMRLLSGAIYECLCGLCTADPQVVKLSDLRRTLIRGCYYVMVGKDHPAHESYFVHFEDCITNVSFRKDVEAFRIPVGKRLVYCCLALALLEAEGLLTPTYMTWLGAMVQSCYELFADESNKVVVKHVQQIGRDGTWAQAFVEACNMWTRRDSRDAVAAQVLQLKLGGGGSRVRSCALPL